ncbi:M23 family metallopeptidase [Mobilitalea sibirica]|uniref:M23 family metallopeptidase n=1 Tax=Mobilitalea sibirica TaxID=1462919 RepID=A0A8J7GZ54_9FIRM|nr:M23 family metallopeptidase [Mobilitalea sibirica]
MKKNKFTEFLKGKGYYVLLFVGVIAIAAIALIGSNLSSDQKDQDNNFVDLNEPDNNIAADDNNNVVADNNQASGDVANNQGNTQPGVKDNSNQNVADNDSLLEFDVYTEAEENGIDLSQDQAQSETAQAEEVAEAEPDAVETSGNTVQADSTPVIDSLKFNKDAGLLWPVEGNVIMKYSMDHVIYHATLMQYKCNPAIIIDAEVGTEVKAAANGIVSSIDTNEETGLTVTMNVGDGYSLVYGQLEDVSLKVGDKLAEGEVIGIVSEPTKYYSVEGSNLYFQVLENEETMNPMLLLR